jgi:hypothetical protein
MEDDVRPRGGERGRDGVGVAQVRLADGDVGAELPEAPAVAPGADEGMHLVPLGEQAAGEVGPDEACGSGDESAHEGASVVFGPRRRPVEDALDDVGRAPLDFLVMCARYEPTMLRQISWMPPMKRTTRMTVVMPRGARCGSTMRRTIVTIAATTDSPTVISASHAIRLSGAYENETIALRAHPTLRRSEFVVSPYGRAGRT